MVQFNRTYLVHAPNCHVSAIPGPHGSEGRDPTARVVVVADQRRLGRRDFGHVGVEGVEHPVVDTDVVIVTANGKTRVELTGLIEAYVDENIESWLATRDQETKNEDRLKRSPSPGNSR